MESREIKRVGYIIVSTDRGLCGGLNINLFKAAIKAMKGWSDTNVEIDLCLIGAKAEAFFRSYGGNVVATARDVGEAPSLESLIGSVKVMLDGYSEGKSDRLYVVSNEVVKTMTQSPKNKQLVPLQAAPNAHVKR